MNGYDENTWMNLRMFEMNPKIEYLNSRSLLA